MKMVAIMWQSYLNMFLHACRDLSDRMESKVYSSKKLEEAPERLDAVLEEASRADMIFLYRANESFWETIEGRLGNCAIGSRRLRGLRSDPVGAFYRQTGSGGQGHVLYRHQR